MVGSGWHSLIDSVYDTLPGTHMLDIMVHGDEAPRISMVKEKFAALRIYGYNLSKATEDAIEDAEGRSMAMCEDCGAPGQVHDQSGWMKTRCVRCKDEYQNELKTWEKP